MEWSMLCHKPIDICLEGKGVEGGGETHVWLLLVFGVFYFKSFFPPELVVSNGRVMVLRRGTVLSVFR